MDEEVLILDTSLATDNRPNRKNGNIVESILQTFNSNDNVACYLQTPEI